jgi:hypothetical protein
MSKEKPWRVRCLRAVEGIVGGRDQLAVELGITKGAIDRWIREERLPQDHIGSLISLSRHRFTADDFLGLKDGKND